MSYDLLLGRDSWDLFPVRSKNANANADVLSRLPLPATTQDLQTRNRLIDPSDLDVYFVGASGIHPSRLRTSLDSGLGRLVNASGGLANASSELASTPDDSFSWDEEGSSVRHGQLKLMEQGTLK